MESIRQQKVNRVIQKELGDIFLKEGKTLFGYLYRLQWFV
jgi:hypothetical protein